ncbi:hypothetical protein LRR81_06860 [Metabacillus sp. GX 13764]|uniref:hypothetical protein n=1 Tax=Metabacillus kandeliae TaxID=2900151 RepID=UPI001E3A8B49|nr:hypothetical protein [Metabacillus kandeliae]MCD7033952.1 hypothetical protein [Metabacillus kandeliae]
MKQVIKSGQPREVVNRIGVIKMELDYELSTLFEAMQEDNEEKKTECKRRLERLRKEWIKLQA